MNKIYNPDDGYDVFYQPYINSMLQDGNRLQPLKNIVEETPSMVVNLSEENLITGTVKVRGSLKILFCTTPIVKESLSIVH
ncbi:MAG: hypothetical protein JWR61_579 [Ferruginibacter sp.]|uniref:hypothetical protein n=1 Tax=Ferruginibacter sp. TaxID=1940288 RepID=UPI002657EA01|nr:hypothetical protein [Ferruginibacter sp.]MDB5275624.1 hypothetical protein [Ferruginibacter sp.]